ncbi:MAG TPA: response regulator [Gammaproteobacteria bacterium]|nr:response regulator [Gammaproteobacteria bacterium]
MSINSSKKSGKVLIVEHDEFNIRVADSFLYACGYANVVIARNGNEALAKFTNDISFILLNVGLPDCSALDVCKKLRQMPRGKSIPILVFTPRGKGIKTKCLKAGVNDVMPSPTSFNEFKNILQRILE